ncbi:MAG: NAD-dependent succinate-semialdehyde dehydrogenase [Bacteroidota bacterium]
MEEVRELLHRKAYIDGIWKGSKAGKVFEVLNPFDKSLIAEVVDCGPEDTNDAIEAAATAFESWKKTTAAERARLLQNWFTLIQKHKDGLARLLTMEQGKPLAEARGEITYGASFIEWFAEEARRAYGEVIPPHRADVRITTLKQPIGVVAAITPWNFPVAMITRKIAPALAAGCTVVVKPSEETPLSALALAELARQAGFPPGVINMLPTNQAAAVGKVLCDHPKVRKLSFTGSTAVGKLLMKQCADTVKKVSLELGGNAPFIVFEDADLDAAVKGAIAAKYRNAGQTCICANRLYVQESIYASFTTQYVEVVKKLKVGNGLEADHQIGPLINEKAIDKVDGLVRDAVAHGAHLHYQGEKISDSFYPLTILTEVAPDMAIHQTEIFGPVTPVYRFGEEAEVIRLANDTPYGLAAYFYGRDYARIWRVAEALEYGMVGINTGAISTTVAPFGGVKESGIGREGSRYGLDEFMEVKYMCWGGIEN